MPRALRLPSRARVAALLAALVSVAPVTTGCRLKAQGPGAPAVQRDLAPLFTLEDEQGDAVNLGALLSRGPVVVYFYRGFW